MVRIYTPPNQIPNGRFTTLVILIVSETSFWPLSMILISIMGDPVSSKNKCWYTRSSLDLASKERFLIALSLLFWLLTHSGFDSVVLRDPGADSRGERQSKTGEINASESLQDRLRNDFARFICLFLPDYLCPWVSRDGILFELEKEPIRDCPNGAQIVCWAISRCYSIPYLLQRFIHAIHPNKEPCKITQNG